MEALPRPRSRCVQTGDTPLLYPYSAQAEGGFHPGVRAGQCVSVRKKTGPQVKTS